MTRIVHRGVKIKAVALKGRDWGKTRMTIGADTFVTAGDEAYNVAWAVRTVDAAGERPEAYQDYWHPAEPNN